MNATAAAFAVLVTIYFWWENIKGIPESSEKALRIMYVTTVMVIMMIVWCGYTLMVRGVHLPPWPHLSESRLCATMRSAGCGIPRCRIRSGWSESSSGWATPCWP